MKNQCYGLNGFEIIAFWKHLKYCVEYFPVDSLNGAIILVLNVNWNLYFQQNMKV